VRDEEEEKEEARDEEEEGQDEEEEEGRDEEEEEEGRDNEEEEEGRDNEEEEEGRDNDEGKEEGGNHAKNGRNDEQEEGRQDKEEGPHDEEEGGNKATPRHPDESHRTARRVLRADDNNRAEPPAALLVSFPFLKIILHVPMYLCTTPGEGLALPWKYIYIIIYKFFYGKPTPVSPRTKTEAQLGAPA